MKKILSLTLLLMLALGINAQQRKTWNFRLGISDATLENLIADPNWTVSNNDDGSFKQAVDAYKMSGTLMANEIVIPELEGLTFGTAGLSGNNNYIIGSNKFRMSRKGEQIKLRVVPGQDITIKARSANSTATKRGITGDANMEYTSGPENGILLGGSLEAEGRDQNGDFTLVWHVSDSAEPTVEDSLDITITFGPSEGGIDISLIQIDNGDVVESNGTKIAYLYDSNYSGYELGSDNYRIVADNINSYISDAVIDDIDINTNTDVTLDSLCTYNVVVVSNAINPATPYVSTIKEAIAYVPMLNLSTSLYSTWGYGTAVDGEDGNVILGTKAMASPLFADENGDIMFDEETGELALLDGTPVKGYTAEAGSYFANDSIWAKAGDVNAIQMHNSGRNTYMMLPTVYGAEFGFELETLIPNAISMLNGTKKAITNTSKPTVTSTFRHLSTTVSLRSNTAGAEIHYTIDGTEPTMESPLYTEPFEISATGVTVKAIAKADGYYVSEVGEAAIEIHELAAAPSIVVEQNDGFTEVTLVPANDGDVMYYNFTGSDLTTASSVYEEGSPITLTKHATITAFTAEQGSYLQSEIVSKDITVQNEKVRMDVVSHMNAAKDDWAPAGANPTYFNTKSGHAYYSDNETGSDEEGNPTYAPANEIVNVNPLKGWEVNTYAQVIFWQNNSATQNVNDENGYNPERALDVNTEITNGCISFGGVGAANSNGVTGPNFTASIQSTEAFQGPFDLVSYISTTGSGAVDVFAYVTTDTLNGEWTELGKLETGTVKRLWRQTVLGYEGTDKVFVKVCGKSGACVFDLFIKNQGELSDEYLSGIQDVTTGAAAAGEVVRTMIYSINGTQLDKAGKGINIVKEVYANGAVKTKKIMVK